MSYVDVGNAETFTAVNVTGKVFLNVKHATMSKIRCNRATLYQEAALKYKTASKNPTTRFSPEYYAYFRRSDGNKLAESKLGSGKVWYELSRQHLSDSLANQLKHFFWKTGQKQLGSLVAPLAGRRPFRMECYGTAMLNVLKARGLVPPSLTRAEFEVQDPRAYSMTSPRRIGIICWLVAGAGQRKRKTRWSGSAQGWRKWTGQVSPVWREGSRL